MTEKERSPLLDPHFLQRLERLRLVSKRMIRGTRAGKRRAKQTGTSLEFADFRSYTPGDDLRQLDWPAYARTGKLFLKTFLDEQEWHISLYLDKSASMTFGQPSKWQRAVQIAAALGYIALQHFDQLSVYAFDQQVTDRLTKLQGKGKAQAYLSFLAGLVPGQEGNIRQALRTGQVLSGKAGLTIICSDFLFAEGVEETLSFLQAAKQQVLLVHLLAEEERQPAWQGDWKLIDTESKAAKEVSLSPFILKRYQETVQQFQTDLAQFAQGRGMYYLAVQPELSMEEIIYQVFQQSGFVR